MVLGFELLLEQLDKEYDDIIQRMKIMLETSYYTSLEEYKLTEEEAKLELYKTANKFNRDFFNRYETLWNLGQLVDSTNTLISLRYGFLLSDFNKTVRKIINDLV